VNWPNFDFEKKLIKQGFGLIAGIDEAGRGPWAGPVVASAVVINPKEFKFWQTLEINDSKKLTAKKRESLISLIKQKALNWAIGIANNKQIDQLGIKPATFLAMQQALAGLKQKCDFLLLDGRDYLDISIKQQAIIKGDGKSISIASASIIAKVTRDKIMQKYEKKFPGYGFSQHKGYGTRMHSERLKKLGPCPIHRMSFKPIKKLLG